MLPTSLLHLRCPPRQVNHILTAKHGYRCAVLLNEIADSADIERALVKEPEVGSLIRLNWAGWWGSRVFKGGSGWIRGCRGFFRA